MKVFDLTALKNNSYEAINYDEEGTYLAANVSKEGENYKISFHSLDFIENSKFYKYGKEIEQ